MTFTVMGKTTHAANIFNKGFHMYDKVCKEVSIRSQETTLTNLNAIVRNMFRKVQSTSTVPSIPCIVVVYKLKMQLLNMDFCLYQMAF